MGNVMYRKVGSSGSQNQPLFTLGDPNPYGTSASDYFGYAVATSGNYAIVGTYAEDDAGGTYSGKAYIYNVLTGELLHILNNPNPYGTSANDYFGQVVDISDNYAIVGAVNEDESGVNSSGKVYIYDIVTGSLFRTLNNPNAYGTPSDDYFGYSVAISGNYVAVGANGEDDTSGTSSGKVYVFDILTGNLIWTLNNPNPYGTSVSDNFGKFVDICSNYIIVGAYQEDDAGGTTSGKVYIFSSLTGFLLWTLDNPNPYGTSASDSFGISVGINNSYAVVSAVNEDTSNGTNSGKVYIFSVSTGGLLYTLDNPNDYGSSANDGFGYAISLSDSYLAVGSYNDGDLNASGSGRVHIYNVSTGEKLFTVTNPSEGIHSDIDYFGWAVGISDTHFIVGAYQEDSDYGQSGNAYIYSLGGNTEWKRVRNIRHFGGDEHQQWDIYPQSPVKTNEYPYQIIYFTNYNNWDRIELVVGIRKFYHETGYGGRDHYIGIQNWSQLGVDNGFRYYLDGDQWVIWDTNVTQFIYSEYYYESPKGYIVKANHPVYTDNTVSTVFFAKTNEISVLSFMKNKSMYWLESSSNPTQPSFTLDNPNPYGNSSSDYFGQSVDISGNYCIVGANYEDDASGIDSGKAYIFNIITGALLWTLNNPNPYGSSSSDYFGGSVAINGNYCIVSANFEESGSGKAYIFDVTTGALLWTLNDPNVYGSSANDSFGRSVDISGNYCIVGAYMEDGVGTVESGRAYIFDVTTGALLWTLNDPNVYGTSNGDNFGYSVAISGNYCIVGAVYEDDASGTQSGKAYVFNVTTGVLLWTLNNPNPYGGSSNDYFSRSIGISGNYCIISAEGEDESSGLLLSGKAYIFDVTTGQLLWTLNNPNVYGTSNGDMFGVSVAINGNYCIVGANAEDDVGGSFSGKAYIFNVTTGVLLWTLNNPNPYGGSSNDYFGFPVSIDDRHCIVGAYGEDDATGESSGKAYIYSLINNEWRRVNL
jgi:outer membrane protein assembly factor BamB